MKKGMRWSEPRKVTFGYDDMRWWKEDGSNAYDAHGDALLI